MMTEKEKLDYCVNVVDKIVTFLENNILNEEVVTNSWYNNILGNSGFISFEIGGIYYRLILNSDLIVPFIVSKNVKLEYRKDDKSIYNNIMDYELSYLAFVDKRKIFKRFVKMCKEYNTKSDTLREQKSIKQINNLIKDIDNDNSI